MAVGAATVWVVPSPKFQVRLVTGTPPVFVLSVKVTSTTAGPDVTLALWEMTGDTTTGDVPVVVRLPWAVAAIIEMLYVPGVV